ncbi:hypothetical protein SDRG_15099 [Saprolegnia diclina VS20]|uniref:Uncharacterized protein n=1 Tax=Saprolegnia diclina (strain VS20) TaxID=1156394 RepID=T0Q148_SAPDV|nr:hypothetical protein SDRG_15099 [Saprolegnia diclina VS20]EQC27090.1 hypothetical protein SDRG_15099 [Saprolegnia diclina VS20]|eukprot:XP_008619484.1 hypothetical protein SDRG_15099 [Saprolegnia diclina VS20]
MGIWRTKARHPSKLAKCVQDQEGQYFSLELPTMMRMLKMTQGVVPRNGACGFSALYGSASRMVKPPALFGRADCQNIGDGHKYFHRVIMHVVAKEPLPKDLWMTSGVTCLAASLWQKPVYVLEAHPRCHDVWRLSRFDVHGKETVFADKNCIVQEAEAMQVGHVLVLENNHYTHLVLRFTFHILR